MLAEHRQVTSVVKIHQHFPSDSFHTVDETLKICIKAKVYIWILRERQGWNKFNLNSGPEQPYKRRVLSDSKFRN